jgi:hypothetical protein
MRLTIIADDQMIGKDSEFYRNIDLSQLPSNVHALQWYDTWGEIEYKTVVSNGVKTRQANTIIESIDPYNWALTAWENAKTAYEAEVAAKEAADAAEQAALAAALEEAAANP